jgi:YggT family protein
VRALIYIIDTIASLFTLILLLRFWLPWVGADFRNPLSQGIVQATSPLINPLRRIVPSFGRIDTATVLVAFLVQAIAITLVLFIVDAPVTAKFVIVGAIFELATLSLLMFTFAIIIRIVLSWIAPNTYNPATALIASMTDPILRPLRRYIPPIGGFDVSPIFAIIVLGALSILLEDLRSLFM